MTDATVAVRPIGHTATDGDPPGREVHEVVLQAGLLRCAVWTYGASLIELWAPDRAGRVDNVAVRLPALADYEQRADDARLGSTMGRYCRMVGGGRLMLDGQLHELDRNAGQHHLHGGSHGFDRQVWRLVAHGTEPDAAFATLQHESADGDQGYPGAVVARATYRLQADGILTVTYEARTSAPTVVGLTLHGYWNLAGTGRIDGHELTVAASRVLVHDADLVPLAEPARVAGGPLDFTAPRRIGTGALDHCYLPDGPQPVVLLRDPASGRELTITTTEPGFAVYTADHFARRRRAGICLQSTALPDAPNQPGFPSARLDPGQTYRHRVVHRFTAR